ncbi:MAG: GNAT family N-acetyltransferase [Leptolyngbyaceae cyanobacterium]
MNDRTALLRPTQSDDLSFVLEAEAMAHAAGYVRLWKHDRHRQAIEHGGERHWIVVDAATQIRVGYVILQGIQDVDQSLLIKRIVISQPGRGYGHSTLRQVLVKAFLEFAAHRVWLDVMADNERARSLYRRLGFVEEGCLRESVKMADSFKSVWLMSMLRSEYLAQYGQHEKP